MGSDNSLYEVRHWNLGLNKTTAAGNRLKSLRRQKTYDSLPRANFETYSIQAGFAIPHGL